MRLRLSLAVAAVFGFVALAQAEPLNVKQVGAGAKWVVQVDVDAAHNSIVLKNVHEKILKEHPEAAVILAGIREVWKFDCQKDLHGLTFWGEQLKKDTGVVLVHAKFGQKLQEYLEGKAEAAPDHKEAKYGKYVLHSWTHDKGRKHQRSMTGAFYGSDILIFGGTVDEVKAALDVLDGAKPSLSGSSPLAMATAPGAILVARVIGIAEADLPHKHPLAKQIDGMAMAAGEYQGESFFDMKLKLKQPELVQQMKAVVEGIRAVALIARGDDAEAVKLISPLKATAEGNVLSIEWRAPAEAVWAHAQKMCAKMKEHHAKLKAHWEKMKGH